MPDLDALIRAHALPPSYRAQVETVLAPVSVRIAGLRARLGRTTVVGVCGAQGSGKSTLCAFMAAMLKARGLSAAVLSLDDLYLTRKDRAALAARVHPLFATRGPPGTHDVALGERVLDALSRSGEVRLPGFDKANDTRTPSCGWRRVQAPVDVVLFEGWCVGASPQHAAALAEPVNALERDEDSKGVWRTAANTALSREYAHLFARLDALVLLAAPDFSCVLGWRALQERQLRERVGPDAGMGEAALERFIRHYERLTRHILAEMPARADAVIPLAADHSMGRAQFRQDGALED